ncbi:FAD-dependent oxidoreductase [Nitrogeniibacter mangrovi]|uniref:FAD-dependent oxidoreductase n=1 Tax=Nitrogeniibacter mangrovi TaxID=2016596 RepID=A0A6C1B2F7_9RHOO|nr:FAD-dependent oxidoreductase [Nitrogeniibacter mangrovi]QID17075.1 FAD-dependent oxidoreductase [Nitrogeniibacter mangrovi]
MDMHELGRTTPLPGQRVAVVGSGIAGLAAAWLLRRDYRVTLFEADLRPGGHTHTVNVTLDGVEAPVDTGFLVFNRRTYPDLCALFEHLGVASAASRMSFSVSLCDPDMEWAGTSLATVFGQRRNLARPAFWRMLGDLVRFNRETQRLVETSPTRLADVSLGEFLADGGYSTMFRDWYLLPMAAAIWSCPTQQMLAYPLPTFLRFCHNHGLLQVVDRPEWMTVRGGGRTYVNRMLADLERVCLGTPVLAARRSAEGVALRTAGGEHHFDAVVFACHSDQTLRMLGGGASDAERAVLGAVRYQPNVAWLHTDPALLPRRRGLWSAWNYMAGVGAPGNQPVSVSYLINQLQPLPFARPVVVSLNPAQPPADEHVFERIEYAHPVFDRAAIAAQGRLADIQGRQRSWFAGAWTGYGFHEDGLRSALAVVRQFGVLAPWRHRRERVSA